MFDQVIRELRIRRIQLIHRPSAEEQAELYELLTEKLGEEPNAELEKKHGV